MTPHLANIHTLHNWYTSCDSISPAKLLFFYIQNISQIKNSDGKLSIYPLICSLTGQRHTCIQSHTYPRLSQSY